MRIRNFEKFQHFKDRCPPWVKLYRDLLDDVEWFELDPKAAKVLVMLWLIASEDASKQGNLPDTHKLAFRLRMSESDVKSACIKLSHWLIQDDIEVISERYQSDAPETETETEKSREETHTATPFGFAEFWLAYPKRVGKGAAEKAWAKARPEIDVVLKAIAAQSLTDAWRKDGGQYIPNPATWINQRRWEDEGLSKQQPSGGSIGGLPRHLMLRDEASA